MFLGYTGVPAADMVERALRLRAGNPTLSAAENSRLAAAAALIR